MNFSDIFKKTFLEGYSSTEMTTDMVAVALLLTAAIGLYIYLVYRIVTRRSFYSKSFNISLVALALITAAIILTIQSSVVISLGMVGALSIVRFRTAIKDPLDLVFLFWAISVGIICGAGLFEVAVTTSVMVTVLILILELLPVSKAPMLLVVNADSMDVETELIGIIRKFTRSYKVKSRNLTKSGMDMVLELRVKNGGGLVKEIGGMDAVHSVSLLSHNGEVTY